MAPDGWQRAKEVFQAAVTRIPEARAAFLDEACRGEASLRKDVESLLAAHDEAGDFLSGGAEPETGSRAGGALSSLPNNVAGESSGNRGVALSPGARLGPYEVVAPLGAGGMGEVYLARDARLDRQIAIKVLPTHYTKDPDRVRRFQREARAASALNHPNILTIHEMGEVEGAQFIATELIEGVTLRERMKGPLSGAGRDGSASTRMAIRDALDVAVQVGSALTAAHAAGVVHRDIKPENIMLRADGYVKVLDFGLAKLTEQRSVSDPEAPTRSQLQTDAGVVMGTASYMSPEQARGLTTDVRTDVWSLGVVLYEMVAGRPPFEGPTTSDVIARILERDPTTLSRHAADASGELERIVVKALKKERQERYQTATDLLIDLKTLKQELEFASKLARSSDPPGTSVAPTSATSDNRAMPGPAPDHTPATTPHGGVKIKRRGRGAIAALLAVLVVAGVSVRLLRRTRSGRTATPFLVSDISRLTNDGHVSKAAISPDGKYVAYVTADKGQDSLWIKQVAASASVQLVPPAPLYDYIGVTFAPNGNYVYFVAGDGRVYDLYQLPILGGTPRRIVKKLDSAVTFSQDGQRLAFHRWSREQSSRVSALMTANVDGTGEREVARHTNMTYFSSFAWSPDGQTIASVVTDWTGVMSDQVAGISVAGGQERLLSPQKWNGIQGDIAWLADGSGLVLAGITAASGQSQLWHLSYPGGEVSRISHDLNDYAHASATADARTLVAVQTDRQSRIWVAPGADWSSSLQITSGKLDGDWGLSWAPDGRIVYESKANGHDNLWIMDADGRNQKQLTFDPGDDDMPFVSSDGRHIFYLSHKTGSQKVARVDMDGGNWKQLTTSGSPEISPECSPDGLWVVYSAMTPKGMRLWKVPADGGDPVQLTQEFGNTPTISPDGKWIAYLAGGPGKIGILSLQGGRAIQTMDLSLQGGRAIQTMDLPSTSFKWRRDGRALTYTDVQNGVSNLWSYSLDSRKAVQLTNFKSDRIFRFDWSRDGKQLALARGTETSDVVLVTRSPSEAWSFW